MWMGFWYLFVCAVVLILIKHHWSRRKIYQLTCSLHGPPALPIFGNALMFWCKEEDIFERLVKVVNNYPSPMRIWLGPKLVVAVKTAHQIEKIFTSSSASSKDDLYRFLKVFNGDSLFTSTGKYRVTI
ncbi:probable cytochrome P450 313b1 isoform X1 [Photinus pyralis]|uniref:probable cytochrome P450 313b1 isoform X1 n=1 Tax=Photinus pyralis TaxID=7054 RepID=UPI0012675222|nr:probable cytochrome P450 313b1 isoform X1 [Photinus pyralis]